MTEPHTWGRRIRTAAEWSKFNPLMKALLAQAYLRRTGYKGKLRAIRVSTWVKRITDEDSKAAADNYLKIEP